MGVYAKEDVNALLETNSFDVHASFKKEKLQAPIQKGEEAATLLLSQQGKVIKEIKLYAIKDVPRDWISFLCFWGTILILIIVSIACLHFLFLRIGFYQRHKKRRLKQPKKRLR